MRETQLVGTSEDYQRYLSKEQDEKNVPVPQRIPPFLNNKQSNKPRLVQHEETSSSSSLIYNHLRKILHTQDFSNTQEWTIYNSIPRSALDPFPASSPSSLVSRFTSPLMANKPLSSLNLLLPKQKHSAKSHLKSNLLEMHFLQQTLQDFWCSGNTGVSKLHLLEWHPWS